MLFDGVVVVTSVIEIVVAQTAGTGIGGISVLRACRLLRVVKLIQNWKSMHALTSVIFSSLSSVGSLTVILLVIMYIIAVVGMQLFGGSYKASNFPEGTVPRWNFTDFKHSFLVVLRILCGEWVVLLWDTMRVTSPAAVLYYLLVSLPDCVFVRFTDLFFPFA